ncbi:hypothetical protein DTO166G4_258 [Paecilomyces variotii]|nr:hypothetical protein DTO166G4_258 [Paecilomyces variotii]KAJ9220267.1 hypothetical protein DTO169C6_7426 [Paecilomyces variotii]KAJ9239901.1 hypothetical protein DTO166G5_2168 [Paecilomyces variotii]KAJ9288932.1 hypothetical protein DTO021C3_3457 [Paecilomyces variotii]KAJ9324081.1 hypothetical protein DTO027B3_4897 [Paecilomyces variotii]
MPPRISSSRVSNSLLPYLSSQSTCPSSSSSSLLSVPTYTSTPSTCRPFSSTLSSQTRLRNQMFEWLNTEGAALKHHIPGTTNYLTDIKDRKAKSQEKPSEQSADGSASAEGAASGASAPEERSRAPRPFPLNPSFVSEPILSEELRNEIYQRVVVQKRSVRAVSVELGVDMRRVGAVVRLVELEKRWKREGKPLALPYARAVREMVPTTPLAEKGQPQVPHESINDLPVHRLTDPQIFYPVSESRQFTRIDAGRVFSGAPALEHSREAELRNADPADITSQLTRHPEEVERVGKGADEIEVLQPADVRIPHPHLISFERDRRANPSEHRERMKRYEQRLKEEEAAEQERKQLAQERREKRITHVEPDSSRFEFRFKDVVVSRETTGVDGRGSAAPGRRYGVPSYDRKKGMVKIPTKVEV